MGRVDLLFSHIKATTTAQPGRQTSLTCVVLSLLRPHSHHFKLLFCVHIVKINTSGWSRNRQYRCTESANPPLTFDSKSTFTDSLFTFFALYLTTLFSLDTWAAARKSPHRTPGNNAFYRPANTLPAADSYQGGMHGRGNAGPGSGSRGNSENVGRVPQARDSRPPMKLFGTAACGACMT